MTKMPSLSSLALTLAAVLASGCAMTGGGGPAQVSEGVLVSPGGLSLYTFDMDPAGGGKSACNGPCATNWPPLLAAMDATPHGDWSIVHRDDGRLQWAYKGKPVYRWAKDTKPGDRSGDGFKSVWHLARP